MKTILLLTVVLSGVLAVAAAAAVAPVEPVQGTLELQVENQVVENEVGVLVPEAAEPKMLSAGEMASSVEGRFFACPAGWERFRSSCYLYVSAGRSWSSAAANCQAIGSSLASVHDLWEYSFLQQLTIMKGGSLAWMGGFYFQTWRWLDQTPFDYSNWNGVNSVSSYQCMYLNDRRGWSNHNCGNGWPSICVKRTDTC